MQTRKIFFTLSVAMLILTAMNLAGFSQDKSSARYPGEFRSYYQEYPIPAYLPFTFEILLESEFSVWGDWTRQDMTDVIEPYWQVSTFNAESLPGGPGNRAWWCGRVFQDDCGTGDFNGYGNLWDTNLIWAYYLSPDEPHSITVRADLNLDTEPGYDFLALGYLADGEFVSVASFSGQLVNEQLDVSFSIEAFEFSTQPILAWHFESDDATSDEDCGQPSLGAAQIDNIQIIHNGEQAGFENNQGTENEWIEVGDNCGNFSNLWLGLGDLDGSASNYSSQVAFLDDGIIEPGTMGTSCVSWCYGYAGYIVNNRGGLCGSVGAVNNEIWSPILSVDAVPFDPIDIHLSFDVYRHEPLSAYSPGIFYYWRVRGFDSSGQPLGPWEHGPYFYGEPGYLRQYHDLTTYLEPGFDKIQVALGMIDLGHVWGWGGYDGTPAPYFDNVTIIASHGGGLVLEADESDLAQDNFPAQGYINVADLGSNYIRVDAARNTAAPEDLANIPQDAIICRALSNGSPLSGPPELHYTIGTNPLFNPYRLPPTGSVVGVPVEGSNYQFAFNLPDVGLMFPGDVMHYYISATNGDGVSATIPAERDGYGVFPGDPEYIPLQYPSKYTMRGLPSMKSADPGDQPKILFWNDFGGRGGAENWIMAFRNLGYHLGEDYDLYYTNHPSSGLGNGLGGGRLH